MKLILRVVLAWFVLVTGASAKHLHSEKYYQAIWCIERGGKLEVVLPSGKRCDCVLSEYAVEHDFAGKWAESLGQALHYASQTGLIPGIVLICEKESDLKQVKVLTETVAYYEEKYGIHVVVWVIKAWEK